MPALEQPTAHRINSISVEKLFGLHDYEITLAGGLQEPSPGLLILYGDNGTGKTTLLNLVYHLLSKDDDQGHRSYLARTPFKQFKVTVDSSITVHAFRESDDLLGSYRVVIQNQGETIADAEAIVADAKFSIKAPANMNQDQLNRWVQFIECLQSKVNVSLFYLPDNRRSSAFGDEKETAELWDTVVSRTLFEKTLRLRSEESDLLAKSVQQLDKWVRDKTLAGTNMGEASANVIYADIVKRIAQTRHPGRPRESETTALIDSLRELELRSQAFSDFGLISPFKLSEVIATFEGASKETQRLIASVVIPYVDGLKVKLDALKEVQELLMLAQDPDRSNRMWHTLNHGEGKTKVREVT